LRKKREKVQKERLFIQSPL